MASIADSWKVIVEGRISSYEIITIPTSTADPLCSLMTIAVKRSIAGDADTTIQALTTGGTTFSVTCPPGVEDQVSLPKAGTIGLFFLHAGTQALCASDPSRLVFAPPGFWVKNPDGLAQLHGGGWVHDPFPYDQFVAALEEEVEMRRIDHLASRASVIARVTIGRRIYVSQALREGREIRYPITILETYRGEASEGACMVIMPERSLQESIEAQPRAKRLLSKLRENPGAHALVFGAWQDSAMVLLPDGIKTIDQHSRVDTGEFKTYYRNAAIKLMKPLAELEPILRRSSDPLPPGTRDTPSAPGAVPAR